MTTVMNLDHLVEFGEGESSFMTRLPVGEIRFDYEYQRQDDIEGRVGKLRRIGFNANAMGVIYVALRDSPFGDEYYCLDGQARTILFRECMGEDALVDVKVYVGLTREGEANLFQRFNKDRKPTSPFDNWKAGRVARDPDILRVDSILSVYGKEIGRSSANPNVIRSIVAVAKLHKDNCLAQAISILTDAFPDEQLEHVSLAGIGYLLKNFPDMNHNRLASVLEYKTQRQWRAVAKDAAEAMSSSSQLGRGWAIQVGRFYNKRLSKGKLDLSRLGA